MSTLLELHADYDPRTMFYAKVVLDSRGPSGQRMTTMEVRYPRFIHSEVMTHRDKSRNSASSRAIPVARQIDAVRSAPAMPIEWGSNRSGMQAGPPITPEQAAQAKADWLRAAEDACLHAGSLLLSNPHKQVVNRVLEPFVWMTVIISATEWRNFFSQRVHPDAQPELQHVAGLMKAAYEASAPRELAAGEWHVPYVDAATRAEAAAAAPDLDPDDAVRRIAVARCARVSYLQHDGTRDPSKDLGMFAFLRDAPHWSPFEHVARVADEAWYANLYGFESLRRSLEGPCMPDNGTVPR